MLQWVLPEASVIYCQYVLNPVSTAGLQQHLLLCLFQLLDKKLIYCWIGPRLRQLIAIQREYPVHDPSIDLASSTC